VEGRIARLRDDDLRQLVARVIGDPRRDPFAQLQAIIEQGRREHLDAVERRIGAKNNTRRGTARNHDHQ